MSSASRRVTSTRPSCNRGSAPGHVILFFVFQREIRRIVYTSDEIHKRHIESLNMQLCKIIKTCGYFPNDDEAAIKLLWLALRNVLAKTARSAFDWKPAMNQFAILFGDRFTQAHG